MEITWRQLQRYYKEYMDQLDDNTKDEEWGTEKDNDTTYKFMAFVKAKLKAKTKRLTN